jgi:succinate dehydrogenase/fumarate reductase flavoprotein subunit
MMLSVNNVKHWYDETDVVIVGFGAAGSCAALGAKEYGADVLVLERGSGISGTTTSATGHFYLGGGTRPQLANNIDDSAEEMFRYLMANTPEPEEEKIRLYCDSSVSHFNWLLEQGVPFNDGFYKKKHYEQPTDECLIWSGNEKVWPISEKAKPAPRGHKVEKEGSEGGGLVMKKLTAQAEAQGVRFQFDANVKHLITNDEGCVVGVAYSHFGEMRMVKSRKGVVLAAGGFAMNNDMIKEYCPLLEHKGVYKQGNPFDDGSAIKMGLAAGGEAIHMDGCLVTAPFYPPENLLKAILVNKHGKRFINEDSYHARSASACLDQDDQEVYLICDNAIFERPTLGLQELIDAWETIAEMESDLGLPLGSLQQTIADYNLHAAEGNDPEQHKYTDWLQPLIEPPYAALQCTLGKSLYVGFTLGGLRVSINAEVLDKNKSQVIKGLYAAGACASNIAQDGAGYSSGTCLGESTFFGRKAGQHAAQQQKRI